MSDLSQVPLQVLEKVRNKWEKIADLSDFGAIHAPCAFCDEAEIARDKAFARKCNYCQIDMDCQGLMDDETPGWNERRERFLLGIRAEIGRRAEASDDGS